MKNLLPSIIDEEFLIKYMNTVAPVGNESEAQEAIIDYLSGLPNVTFDVDVLGTLYVKYSTNSTNIVPNELVVLDAHADEISWRVNTIGSDGLISVIRNGGSDHMVAASKEAVLITESGDKFKGVFGFPAIHTRREDPTVKTSTLIFDLGFDSDKEVLSKGINVGDIICYADEFRINKDSKTTKYIGRALDNKIGGYIMARVIRMIAESNIKLDFDLVFVNAVQEEVGLYGAKVAANKLRPNKAIVVDVCHDTNTPGINKNVEGDITSGKGLVLAKSPAINSEMFKDMVSLCKNNSINFQRTALGSQTGTNTDEYVYGGNGCAAQLISIPLKYMHTTVETCSETDVEGTIRLILDYLTK